MSDQRNAFTGRSRQLSTKRSVKIADWVSQALITVGGIGTILAVATVALFLVVVVSPLFQGAEVEPDPTADSVRTGASAPAIAVASDEYLTTGWTIDADGTLSVFRGDTGETFATRPLFTDRRPTAWSAESRRGLVIAGFEDGTVQVVTVRFETRFLDDRTLDEGLLDLAPGDMTLHEGAMVERTVEGQFRRQEFFVTVMGEPLDLGDGAVLMLDHAGSTEDLNGTAVLGDPETGVMELVTFRGAEEEDMFSGEVTLSLSGPRALELPETPGTTGPPSHLTTAYGGTNRYLAWDTGTIARYARGDSAPAELVDASGARITVLQMLLGERTLIVGRADGTVEGWFPARRDDAAASDGFVLEQARTMASTSDSPVRTIANASRNRMFIAGHDDGTFSTYYMVSGERLAELRLPDPQPITALAVSPKEDAILVATRAKVSRYAFEPMYPEASFSTLFFPLWYEGYPESDFVWQSSAATDESEPKLSLIPLIFGTLKATFYSMIFGAPVALMAAIYTSEFLNPKIKAWVKPAIEMMASLPSVVLGFLAALVFAPVIEDVVPAVLALFMVVPLVLVLGAFLWQLLPQAMTIRLAQMRIAFVGLVLPLGVGLSLLVGPLIENVLFGGSLRLWLNGLQNPDATGPGTSGALGGWVLLLTPLSAIAVGWIISRFVGPRVFSRRTSDRREAATRDLLKFAVGIVATLLVAFGLGAILSGSGFDVRGQIPGLGSFADTYDQRNSLVVGFVMGFAIIPIIYTIADDALSTVPEHLRGASLGAGATPWQTAVRIVVPTAMSGLFSAVMIGLGRAVGETMIVLMALGNTPVMNINVFEGARTLSANLAVELPEAPQGGGHYRVLFLSALVLFAMTFVLNTAAESIRLRFRKRAYQL